MAKILVVDDDEQVRETFSEILAQVGHYVDGAATAYQACIMTLTHDYDLAFVDLVMGSDGSGEVAALALRGIGFKRPLIVVSGSLSVIEPKIEQRIQIAGRLLKPLSIEDLVNEVKRQLKNVEKSE